MTGDRVTGVGVGAGGGRVTCHACKTILRAPAASDPAGAPVRAALRAVLDGDAAALVVCGKTACVDIARGDLGLCGVEALAGNGEWLSFEQVRQVAGGGTGPLQTALNRLERRGVIEIKSAVIAGGPRSFRLTPAARSAAQIAIVEATPQYRSNAATPARAATPCARTRTTTPSPRPETRVGTACGYLSSARLTGPAAARLRRGLVEYAHGQGWELAEICEETTPGARTAWELLRTRIAAIGRERPDEPVAVLVPDLDHLAVSARTREAMLDQLDRDGAAVLIGGANFGGGYAVVSGQGRP